MNGAPVPEPLNSDPKVNENEESNSDDPLNRQNGSNELNKNVINPNSNENGSNSQNQLNEHTESNRVYFSSAKKTNTNSRETTVKPSVSNRAIGKTKNMEKNKIRIHKLSVPSTSKQSAAIRSIVGPNEVLKVKKFAHLNRFANMHTCETSNSFDILSDDENTQNGDDMEVHTCSDDDDIVAQSAVLKRKRNRKSSDAVSVSSTDSHVGKVSKLNEVEALNDTNKSQGNNLTAAQRLHHIQANRPPLKVKKPATSPMKAVKMPVIVVTLNRDTCAALVRNLTATFPKVQFQVKPSQFETRFYADDEASHNEIRAYLRTNEAPYYSHPVGGKEKLRVILSRCFDTDEKEINAALTEAGKPPCAIRKLGNPHNPKYGIDFEKSVTTLNDLQTNCSLMNRQRVKWELSISKLKGPTVCYRCAMIGHGFADCTRDLWCCFCSKNHSLAQCPSKNDLKLASCINCKLQGHRETNHPANSPDCRTALDYTKDRKEWRESNSPKKSTKASFNINNSVWTSLRPLNSESIGSAVPTAPASTGASVDGARRHNNKSYAGAARGNNSPKPPQNKGNEETTSTELFDIGELFELMTDAIEQLKGASSKLEQMNICIGLLKKCL